MASLSVLIWAAIIVAVYYLLEHARPNAKRVERRRRRWVEARALYEAEAAALQAYEQVVERAEQELDAELARLGIAPVDR